MSLLRFRRAQERRSHGADWSLLLTALALAMSGALASACGKLEAPGGGYGGSADGDDGGATGGSSADGGGTATGGLDGGGNGYVDPDCPDAPPPEPSLECDLEVSGDCGEGYACYPYIVYPYGSSCAFLEQGTACMPVGVGVPGDACAGPTDCAEGNICVVGSAGGARCAELCSPRGAETCPLGLICVETDVPGYGVCS